MARVTTAYVSKFQRTRIHGSRLIRGEVNTLVCDLNGILASGEVNETISSVIWRIQNPCAVILSDCAIYDQDRKTSVTCQAGFAGGSVVKCLATTSLGSVITQLFVIRVFDQPWFESEVSPGMGPYSISAAA